MEELGKKEWEILFKTVLHSMEAAKEELIALDGAMGDGDLGLTMCHGFEAVCAEIASSDETDIGKLMMRLGMKMNAAVPSTMGTLVATCFLKAAPAAKGRTTVGLAEISDMAADAVKGVMERGGAKPGDKTMLDALAPAAAALQKAAGEQKTLAEAFEAAYAATKEGAEATRAMQSVHGRAAYYREKSVGKQDPGATAVMYIVRGLAEGVSRL